MAISGQIDINIGAPNDPVGSDSLYTAFTTVQQNFDNLFANSANAANSGISSVDITSNTITVTNNSLPGAANYNIDLPIQPNVAGSYSNPNVTVDSRGRVVLIANGGSGNGIQHVTLLSNGGIGITANTSNVNQANYTITNEGVTSIIAGNNISISSSNGAVRIDAIGSASTGTVSSVGLKSDNNFTINNSPITGAGNIQIALSPNISVGNVSVSNNIYANAGIVQAVNFIGTFGPASSAQPNITSLGTLTSLLVSNGITAASLVANGNITATNIQATGNGQFANLTTTNASITTANIVQITGNITGRLAGDGSSITNINANAITTGTLSNTVITGSYPNITGIGNLNALSTNTISVANTLSIVDVSNVLIQTRIMGQTAQFAGTLNVATSVTAPLFIGNVQGNISGTLVAPGSDTEVLFNDNGNVNGSSYLTFVKGSGALTLSGTGPLTANGGFTLSNGAFNVNGNGNISFSNGAANFSVAANATFGHSITVGTNSNGNSIFASGNISTSSGVYIGNSISNTVGVLSVYGDITGSNIVSNGNITVSGSATSDFSGNILLSNSTFGFLTSMGNQANSFNSFAGVVKISNTTDATTTTDAALVVSGGIAVSGKLFSNSIIRTQNQVLAFQGFTGNSLVVLDTSLGPNTNPSAAIYNDGTIVTEQSFEIFNDVGNYLANTAPSGLKGAFYANGDIITGGKFAIYSDIANSANLTSAIYANGTISVANIIQANLTTSNFAGTIASNADTPSGNLISIKINGVTYQLLAK